MNPFGYAGQIVHVDLSAGKVEKTPLDPDMARAFIGGFGINTRLAYDYIQPGVGPLAPDNFIILGTGALGGTMAPGSSRLSATTKFPETGAVATGNGSLNFASQLKWAGYDHLVITGRAGRPVYINILDEDVTICDANDLWGLDLIQSTDALRRKHGKPAGIVAIGQAGENRAGISFALVDKSATLGKGGLGAVMGSKNLKAIVVKGTKSIKIADHRRFFKMLNQIVRRVRAYPLHGQWIEKGINLTMRDTIKNDPDYGIRTYLEKLKQGRLACPSCPMADKEVLGAREGEYRGLTVYTAGWSGRAENFGQICNAGGANKVLKCLDTANRYGIDSHSFSRVMKLAVELYEEGIITPNDTDGLVLKKDFETIQALLRQVAFRQGLGDVLADGMKAMIARFGPEVEKKAAHVKGMETIFDPRRSGLGTMEFELTVNPRGGHHTAGGSPSYVGAGQSLDKFASHCERMGASGEAVKRILDSDMGFNVGRLSRYSEDWYSVLSGLGFCNRAQMNRFYSIGSCAEFYSAATGIETDPEQLATAGERIWNVKKASNVREGFTREDDRFPPIWFETCTDASGQELNLRDYYGTRRLTRKDGAQLLDDYYDERGWDRRTGVPTREKLASLGLDRIAADLEEIEP
jgi:aldehyde:ferredoxin oxidoreductase